MKRILSVALLLNLTGLPLTFSQVPTGSISGTVVDTTGAAILGAEITVTNQGSGQTFTAVSSDVGSFVIPSLVAGLYTVRVSLLSFKTFVAADLKVNVGEMYSLVAKLQIGEVTEEITVAAGVDIVNTTETQISNTVSKRQIDDLPLNGRDPLNLILLQAGTALNGNTYSTVSGTRSSFTNLTLDGVNIQDNFIRANAVNFSPNRPTVQQVAEFTIITQNQGPEAGFGSSQVSLVTPSGTNEFHGELFWFYRSDGLAANSFFNNLAGLEKPNLVRNQFGFTLAGPFVKDRLLFFAHYEGQRVRRGLGQDTLILTPDARQGIFTYEDLEGNIRKLNILGAAEVPIDPFVANLLKNIPTDINNFLVGDSSQNLLMNNAGHRLIQNFNNNRAQGGLRLDFLLSDDQSFEWTYKVVDDEQDRPDIYEGFNRDPKIKTISKFNHFFSGAWRWVMAPTMLNEVRVGGHQGPVVFDTFEDFSAGFKICPVCDGLQNPLVFSNPVDNFERQGRNTNTYTIQDNASWQRGAHSVRFGFQTQFIRSLDFGSFDVIPTYELGLSPVNPTGLGPGDFPGGTSAAAATNANNLLAALGGILASGRQEFNVPLRGSPFQAIEDRKNWEYDTFAFYFGDAWRIHPRITFNVGLRWEYYLQLKERGDLITQPEIRSGQTMRDAVLDPEGQINFITEDLTNADLNNWAPNIGIAWDPFGDGRTALRAGYGISYANDEGISAARNAINRYGVQAVVTRQNLTGSISQGLPDFSTPEVQAPTDVPGDRCHHRAGSSRLWSGSESGHSLCPILEFRCPTGSGFRHGFRSSLRRHPGNKAGSFF